MRQRHTLRLCVLTVQTLTEEHACARVRVRVCAGQPKHVFCVQGLHAGAGTD